MSYIYTYAQNYEDVMLWRALKHIDKGFYIDIGAAWPTVDSVTKLFYDKGWRGINIEPNPQLFQAFESERSEDININAGVASDLHEAEFFVVGQTGLSTANKTFADEYIKQGMKINPIKIKIYSLNEIWQQFVGNQEVHFLKIDVEGLETSIVKSNNWQKNRPWVLVIEATLPMSQEASYMEWEEILLKANYLFAYQDGLNRFYVAAEHESLLKAFASPPNVFDNFVRYDENTEENHYVKQLKRQLEHLQKSYDEVIMSTSWKVTTPLRWVMQWVNHGVKK